jgi:hypothetical protein
MSISIHAPAVSAVPAQEKAITWLARICTVLHSCHILNKCRGDSSIRSLPVLQCNCCCRQHNTTLDASGCRRATLHKALQSDTPDTPVADDKHHQHQKSLCCCEYHSIEYKLLPVQTQLAAVGSGNAAPL